jgi:MoxR-like ATPase
MKQRIQQLVKALANGIYEKEEPIKLALLAAIAGESIFLIGPPGVAKSLIARRLKFAFKNGTSFEYLMNKFSTPDEIFGPVSIKKLKDEDKYERLTEKYLPGANIVFLDEIWKAGSSIQNALLTIINEKIYRNGEQEVKVDIKTIIAASNELPIRGEGLEALWDRFLIRYTISEIKQKNNFIQMITGTQDVYQDDVPEAIKISNEELFIWDEQINQIAVPEEVLNTIQLIKYKLDEYNASGATPFEIYDRRWKKIIRLLRTSAFLNGRTAIDLMDCFLIVHCLWNNPQQMTVLQEIVAETVRKHGYTLALNLSGLRKEIAELDQEVKDETKIKTNIVAEKLYLIDKIYYEILHISKYFDGKYIKAEEYDRLQLDQYDTISLYDDAYKLTYKIKAKLTVQENRIEIFHNSQTNVFEMKTVKADTVKLIDKAPHPILKKYWDERIAALEDYIVALKTRLDSEMPSEIKDIRKNIFVHSDLAEIVQANLNDVVNAVNSEQLKVEKIKFYYTNI